MSGRPTIRESMGLEAAANGDVAGVSRFLRFIADELADLESVGLLPESLIVRLHDLCREAAIDAEFAAGFAAGLEAQTQTPRRKARKGTDADETEAQRGQPDKPTVPARKGDEPTASEREPVSTGSGEAQGRSEPASPPIPAVKSSRPPTDDELEIPAALRRS